MSGPLAYTMGFTTEIAIAVTVAIASVEHLRGVLAVWDAVQWPCHVLG